jgi:diguanylate cyclase (GGDEF)-like protein/PAS domain S-box-containing protein
MKLDMLNVKQLALTEADYQFFFNKAPIGLCITNPQGSILTVNNTLQDWLGYSEKELLKINAYELYYERDLRKNILNIINESGQIRNFENALKRKDGTYFNVLINSDLIYINNKKVFLNSIYDITPFKQIQDALIASEEQYRNLFNKVPIGITVTDFQGNLIASNQGIKELMGYSDEDITTENVIDFYTNKDDRQRFLNLTKKNNFIRDFETTWKRKDGKIVNILINTDLITYKGQQNILLNSIRDITKRKVVEDQLKKERDFINAILETASSLVVVFNTCGEITMFNRACELTTGYLSNEFVGKVVWDVLSFDKERIKDGINKLLGGDHTSNYEGIILAKNNKEHLISWTNTVLLDAEGQVEFIIATGIDITEQKQAEIELQNANQKLVSWVNELEQRTAEMTLLGEMSEQLQSCQTIEEACAISAQYIQKICPESQGALYLINSAKDLAEVYATWGEGAFSEREFPPLNCWAIRRGRPHLIDDSHPGLHCEHIINPGNGQYLCVPMLVNGEVIGILHLKNKNKQKQDQQESIKTLYTEHKAQLVNTIADSIALSLSNLKLKETLRQQSIRDALTGLFNRRYMEESLTRELKRAERESKPIGLMMFDIDNFKKFNDAYGHDAGDSILREIGFYLNKSVRGEDIVCRYGGEEFLVILPGATLEATKLRAEKLRNGIKELTVYYLGKPLSKCTVSIGISEYPKFGSTNVELIKKADEALYKAKSEGRDRVEIAASDE